MAAQYIQLNADSTGKKVEGFQNSISGNDVIAQALHPVTSTGVITDPPVGKGWTILGNKSSGQADAGSPVKLAGVYNSTRPTVTTGQRCDLQVDAAARIYTASFFRDSPKVSYSGCHTFTPDVSATDVWVFAGSATKVVKIQRIKASFYYTSSDLINVSLVKRSALNTGGTATTWSQIIPPLQIAINDSLDVVSTVTIKSYTANPSGLGSSVGALRTTQVTAINSTTAATFVSPVEWFFGRVGTKAPTLRSASQTLCLNLNSATITGLTIEVDWTEE